MSLLGDAVRYVEENFPLPRCPHGSAFRDHAYELLEPPCGCRLPTADVAFIEKTRCALLLGLITTKEAAEIHKRRFPPHAH